MFVPTKSIKTMKDLLENIPKIEIELEWDGDEGSYDQTVHLLLHGHTVVSSIQIEQQRSVWEPTHELPGEVVHGIPTIFVKINSVCKDEEELRYEAWEEEFDKLALEIEHNIVLV